MQDEKILVAISERINAAPKGERTPEIHLQLLKYASDLSHMRPEDICKSIDIPISYSQECRKMRKIFDRLVVAGLEINRI